MELGNTIFGNSRGDFEINRNYQDLFCEYLQNMGFDSYGNIEDLKLNKINRYKGEYSIFENNIFLIFPYYWNDCLCEEYHDYFCPCNIPNFWYKSKNIKIKWYKYPLRDSYSNIELDERIIKEMFEDCLKSIK
jgi:hypothetical protein